MLNALLVSMAAAVAVLLGYAATRPGAFRIARSVRIAAPPAKILPWIEDLRAHERWSPYYRKDPAIQLEYDGPARGVGATCTFEGNREVGSGRVTVTGSAPPGRVCMRLQMIKPFKADNVVEYTLAPQGAGATEVTWSMTGRQPLPARVACLFFDLDRMVGTDFAAGLAQLKALVEGRAVASGAGDAPGRPTDLGTRTAT